MNSKQDFHMETFLRIEVLNALIIYPSKIYCKVSQLLI